MILDMLKLGGRTERRQIPVEISHPVMKSRVPAPNIPNVAFEVLDIDSIEPDDGREETDVSFGGLGAVVVGSCGGGELGFDAVEGFEELGHCFSVGLLGAVESVRC